MYCILVCICIVLNFVFAAPVKRRRGRPRRYPRAGEGNPTQIPAVIIPGPNGQTLMMAPIKVQEHEKYISEHFVKAVIIKAQHDKHWSLSRFVF